MEQDPDPEASEVTMERLTDTDKQALHNLFSLSEESHKKRLESASCALCLDERFVLDFDRMKRCPSCNSDTVEAYGFKWDGRVLSQSVFMDLPMHDALKGSFAVTGSVSIWGKAGAGKTTLLRTIYNESLDKLRFRDHILMVNETSLFRAFRRFDESAVYAVEKHRVKVVLVDEFCSPEVWCNQGHAGVAASGPFQAYYDFLDTLYDRRGVRVVFAGNENPLTTIQSDKFLRRVNEICNSRFIECK